MEYNELKYKIYVLYRKGRKDINYELELYKLITGEDVDEFGWVSDEEFYVWVSYYSLSDYMKEMKRIFGYGLFDDSSFNANMRDDCICFNLCEAVGDYLNVEDVFSKDKYRH